VLLSSHILAEVEALCDRVSIIRDGRTVEEGTLSELRHLTRTSVAAETQRPIGGLDGLGGVHDAVIDGNHVTCEVDSAQLGPLMTYLVGFGIVALTSTPPTLEELFLRHYGDERARETSVHLRAETGVRP
ncbi:MAG: ABC-2 type transport system ATP-binding protein, partial [Rhodococcus sp. (in: high G+C Gram-positive bacteria)]